MDVRVSENPAVDAAAHIAERLRRAVQRRGHATMAVSGGSTAPPLFAALLDHDVAWAGLEVWQVDERVAPDGDDDRNANQLTGFPATVHLMGVTDSDLPAAARRYGESIPDSLDIVHLGVGDDGHTASWPPRPHVDSDAIERLDRAFVVRDFNGRDRMTFGPVVVEAARDRVVLATGGVKADVIRRWIVDRDPTLPISAVPTDRTVVFLDPAAAAELDRR